MDKFLKIPDLQNEIEVRIKEFNPFYLEDLPADNQMTRYDNKFVFCSPLIPEIISKASKNYSILEVSGNRYHPYRSIYFDTEDYQMYNDHHNGKSNRHKIRIREYLASGNIYFEIKKKTNKGFTIKKRAKIENLNLNNEIISDLIKELTPYRPSELHQTVVTQFNRLTFFNKISHERVTLDYCIELSTKSEKKQLPCIGIIEIKKKDYHTITNFERIIDDKGLSASNFSKYCMALAYLDKSLKHNRFKENFLFINKLENEFYRTAPTG